VKSEPPENSNLTACPDANMMACRICLVQRSARQPPLTASADKRKTECSAAALQPVQQRAAGSAWYARWEPRQAA